MKPSFLIPAILALLPGVAFADLEFCNESHTTVHIAIGYRTDDVWISEGWWEAAPGRCVTAVAGDLQQRYYYYHADATDPDYSFDDDDAVYTFCVQPEPFTIHGDEQCESRGYFGFDFNELDTGDSRDFTLTLQ